MSKSPKLPVPEKKPQTKKIEPKPPVGPKPRGLEVEAARLRDEEIWKVPEKYYPGDAGADLTISRHVTVNPSTRAQLPTNMAVAIPRGYFGLVLPRSSTLHKRGLIVHPGILDEGYRGEVQVLVFNPGQKGVFVQEGERLAQLLVLPVVRVTFKSTKKLTAGERDTKGFGSTGGFGGAEVLNQGEGPA